MEQAQCLDDDVRNLVADILEQDPASIDADARLIEDLGMDSMMALEIIASLERKYKVKLPEAELPNVTTINRVIALAKRYVR
jgi:acyl carrier protein